MRKEPTVLKIILFQFFLMISLSFGAQDKPNLVIIVSDALRADYLGCYGGPAKTPHIDWLAKNGVLFKNAFSASTWTPPASVTMFTGKYPTQYSMGSVTVNSPIVYLMPFFSAQGKLKDLGYSNSYYYSENGVPVLNNLFEGLKCLKTLSANSKGLSFKKIAANSPFLQVIWFINPHAPYKPSYLRALAIRSKYKNIKFPLNVYLGKENIIKFYSYRHRPKFWRNLSADDKNLVRDLYTAEVEMIDKNVGEIINILKKNKTLQHTVIVFTSDHGEILFDVPRRGVGHRGPLFFQTTHIPLIIYGYKIPHNKQINTFVSHLDYMPTFEDIAGAESTEKYWGRSLLKIIQVTENNSNFDNREIYLSGEKRHQDTDFQEAFIDKEGNKLLIYNKITSKAMLLNIVSGRDIPIKNEKLKATLLKKLIEHRELVLKEKLNTSTNIEIEKKRKLFTSFKALGYLN